jgi:hypothetical protein
MFSKPLEFYIKWLATAVIMVSVTMLAGEWFYPYNVMLQFFGNCLWIWVGILWRERTVILTNLFCNLIMASVLIYKFLL